MFETLIRSKLVIAATALFVAVAITPGRSDADQGGCIPVSGHFVTEPADLDGDPDTLDFTGPVNGSIQGIFEARDLQLIPGDSATPDLFLFTEQLDLIADKGSLRGITLKTVGEGSFDTVTGLFTEILTIIDSVGEDDITGQMFFFGDFDPVAAIGDGDYRGEVCFGND